MNGNGRRLVLTFMCGVGVLVLSCSQTREKISSGEPNDIQENLIAAFSQPHYIDRFAGLSGVLSGMTAENLDEFTVVFDQHMAGLSVSEVRMFMSAWAKRDPESALAYAQSIPFSSQREEALGVVVYESSIQDPKKGMEVAESLILPNRERDAAPRTRLVRGWAYQPNSGLQDFLVQRGFQGKEGELISAVLQELYRGYGGQRLIDWTNELIAKADDEVMRGQIYRKAVRTLALREPALAADWAVEVYGEDPERVEVPVLVAESWARRDPLATIEWIRLEAPEEIRAKTLESTVRWWLNHHGLAAREWITSVGDDPFYLPAYAAVGKNSARGRDMERAIEYCDRLPPSELRQECLYVIGDQWYGFDPVAAGRWMEESALSEKFRESIRSAKRKQHERRMKRRAEVAKQRQAVGEVP